MVNKNQLKNIANVLRTDVIKMTSYAGSGHPSSCMSCAEIMSVLFFNEMFYDIKNPNNKENDEFILSKGHAAPILYSCLYRVGAIRHHIFSLRKLKSPLEGHPIPSTHIPWVKVATGSLGQGLSVGVGMALAGKISKRKYKTYVLMGDSETAEGSIYEALQLGSYYKLNNLIGIIDVNRLGQRGETMIGYNIKKYKKMFSSFGWNTISIDGHNISQILSAVNKTRKSNKPTIIIAKTIKGKGLADIENKNGWHGKPFPLNLLEKAIKVIKANSIHRINIKFRKESYKENKKVRKIIPNKYTLNQEISTREAYGNALSNLAVSNPNVIVIDAEVSNSTYSGKVKEKTPKQFIESFISEQNMIGVALGLSKKGFNVFSSTFSAFLSRAHDQIRMSSLSSPNFTICGSHCGVSIGEDGPSQMGLEDISMFRALSDSIIFYPSDSVSTEKLIYLCSKIKGLKYIRTTRSKTKVIYDNKKEFLIGEFNILKQSKKDDIVLIGSGITLHESLKAYEQLNKDKINSAVIDLYCIKPLNSKRLIKFIKNHGSSAIITEDHRKEGGIGEMIISKLKNTNIKIKHLSIESFSHSGTKEQLLKKHKIDSNSIRKAAKSILKM